MARSMPRNGCGGFSNEAWGRVMVVRGETIIAVLVGVMFFCIASPPLARAQGAARADCRQPATQSEMNRCAGDSYRQADGTLNVQYRQIMNRLKGDAAAAKSLTAAQRAWIGFRDAECAFQGSATEGGSIHSFMMSSCLESLTRKRIADFTAYLACKEGDMSCPVPGS